MAIVDFKRLKEVASKAKETHLIDLGKFVDKNLEGVIVPIRAKSIEECIAMKNKFKPKGEKLTIEYKQYGRTPKDFRDMYSKQDGYNAEQASMTYFQFCKVNEDESKIERNKYRERLFNILIHFDMEYKTEDGKTLWEDAGLKKDDYNGLIDIFSDIIKFQAHLDTLDIIIEQIKNGTTDESLISAIIANYNIRKVVNAIEDEEERRIFVEKIEESVKKAREEIENKITEKEE